MADDGTNTLFGSWESTEAFGNTSLDWSQALKEQRVRLAVSFTSQGEYAFELFTQDTAAGERTDVTSTFRHVVAAKGKYELKGEKGLLLEGDSSGIQWTYQREEGDTLRLRLEGAKRFGRCKGVDVIYFKRVEPFCNNSGAM